ncbi:MAG: type II CRISPR RNA-guided endonuclease Cas9, partial [Bacteroidetes bacterium]
ENHFQGLQSWLASYIVYGRHSEASTADKWDSVSDLENYLKEFKQHSLRNPIVEQVVTETLRVVKDIWQQYGNGVKDFFDEIHVELGREMKNTAEDRKKISDQVIENENTNLRIKSLLAELKNDPQIDNVRPYSPIQQEALKIFEDGVLSSDIEIPDDIIKISKTAQPSSSELQRYKLWLEQKYRSPYTGEMIPLSKLFTTEYEIEHIIPQSRYFDDSFNNKVICESSVNKLKDNQIGLEFIKNHHGETVETGFGKSVKVFETNDYEDFVKTHYIKNRSKRNKLLMEDIPEKMIERQINDTRYISKFISSVLSNIVRAEKDDDGINSKNLIPGNGKITTILKRDWGLNDIWNDLILPRFERMNKLTNSEAFTEYNAKHQKQLPKVPLEYSKNFQPKRIDHRHHALDALVVACASRDHLNLLNNKFAKSNTRFDLNRKLRKFEKVVYNHPKSGERIEREIPKEFLKPWNNFTVDARNSLENIVISFKQNLRVINKATNYFEKWVETNGTKTKKTVQQNNGDNWAIRKPMHKETVSGKVELARIKVPKDKILTATRKSLDTSFDLKTIESITDTGIQKILINYLASKDNNPELAFSPEGIEDMNKNILLYNDGIMHQPIYKVRVFEIGSKFPLGETINKKNKYVEAAKGTNLFFAIYQDENDKRSFETIPLNIVIERQKQGLSSVPETNDKGNSLLFYLSPNDLVYVPTEEETINQSSIGFTNLSYEQKKRLYNVNDFSSTCYFTPNHVAKAIAPKEIDLNYDKKKNKTTGSFDTKTASIEGIQIKDVCIPLKVDRLGNIKLINDKI